MESLGAGVVEDGEDGDAGVVEDGTKRCVHCGRKCGDDEGGLGGVDGLPVCHPNVMGRPGCLDLITKHGHRLVDCAICSWREGLNDQSTPSDRGPRVLGSKYVRNGKSKKVAS